MRLFLLFLIFFGMVFVGFGAEISSFLLINEDETLIIEPGSSVIFKDSCYTELTNWCNDQREFEYSFDGKIKEVIRENVDGYEIIKKSDVSLSNFNSFVYSGEFENGDKIDKVILNDDDIKDISHSSFKLFEVSSYSTEPYGKSSIYEIDGVIYLYDSETLSSEKINPNLIENQIYDSNNNEYSLIDEKITFTKKSEETITQDVETSTTTKTDTKNEKITEKEPVEQESQESSSVVETEETKTNPKQTTQISKIEEVAKIEKTDNGQYVLKDDKDLAITSPISEQELVMLYIKGDIPESLNGIYGDKTRTINLASLPEDDFQKLTGIDLEKLEKGDIKTANQVYSYGIDEIIYKKYSESNKIIKNIQELNSEKTSLTNQEIIKYANAGVQVNNEIYIKKVNDLDSKYKKLKALEKTQNPDEKQIAELEKEIKELETLIKKTDDPLSLMLSLPEEQRNTLVQGMDCETEFSLAGIGCAFSYKLNQKSLAVKTVTQIANQIRDECSKEKDCDAAEYNKRLEERIQEITDKCEQESTEDCQILVDEINKQKDKLKELDVGIGFSILEGILRPDRNALRAAKLFGFEEDYTNIPVFLKENFPSQMCMAKIEGYLDKTIENNGGITKYSCPETYTAKYNEQTQKYEQVGNPNCLNVVLDLRAQRTKITPDGNVAITYSYFYRAPIDTDVNLILAVSYKEDGKTKKQLLTQELIKVGAGNTTKGFDSVNLNLNSTNSSNIPDTKDSFQIGILAIDAGKRPVISQSVPIVLITTGDSYSFNLYDNTRTSNLPSSEGTQEENVAKELTAQDMLGMI